MRTIKKIEYANEAYENAKENIKKQKITFKEGWNKWGKKSMNPRNIP